MSNKLYIADRDVYKAGLDLSDAALGSLTSVVAAALTPIETTDHRVHFVIPDGYTVDTHDLSKSQPRPDRKRGTAQLRDIESFIYYVEQHGEPGGTEVFMEDMNLRAVLNGHGVEPGWGDHIATYTPRFTPAWTAWTGFDRQQMQQGTFADFLDNRMGEIAWPDGAEVSKAIRDLKLKYEVQFERTVPEGNDFINLVYKEEAAAGSIKVPNHLILKIPMIEGDEGYQVNAKLTFTKPNSEGRVTFRYELGEEVHDIKIAAQTALREKLRDGTTNVPVYIGTWSA